MFASLPDGLRMFYEEAGAGLPVVLIHGLRLSHVSWRHQVPELARRYRVIAPDLRGHGQTDAPAGPYSVELFAADVAALLDLLDAPRAVLVGHSMGSAVALTFAVTYPERTLGVAVVAGTSQLSDEARDRLSRLAEHAESGGALPDTDASVRAYLARGYAEAHPEEVAAEAAAMSMDLRGYVESVGANVRRNLTPRLGEVGCPLLFVGGQEDGAGAEASTARFKADVPHVEAHVLPGVGHMIPMEAPQLLNQLLGAFIERLG